MPNDCRGLPSVPLGRAAAQGPGQGMRLAWEEAINPTLRPPCTGRQATAQLAQNNLQNNDGI
jgi:hypothetical protein